MIGKVRRWMSVRMQCAMINLVCLIWLSKYEVEIADLLLWRMRYSACLRECLTIWGTWDNSMDWLSQLMKYCWWLRLIKLCVTEHPTLLIMLLAISVGALLSLFLTNPLLPSSSPLSVNIFPHTNSHDPL